MTCITLLAVDALFQASFAHASPYAKNGSPIALQRKERPIRIDG